MSTPVTLSVGSFPEGYCWKGPQQYADDLVAIMSAYLSGDFTPFQFGPTAPADLTIPWIKTLNTGAPDGLYIHYGGFWVRPHAIPFSSSYRALWVGVEAPDIWFFDGGDGMNPAGFPPTAFSGAMWEVDHDFDFRAPMGPGTNPVAYGGVHTTVAVGGNIGVEKVQLSVAELPAHHHTISPILIVADYSHPQAQAGLNTDCSDAVVQTDDTGSGDYHQNMPPCRGAYMIKRTARQFYLG